MLCIRTQEDLYTLCCLFLWVYVLLYFFLCNVLLISIEDIFLRLRDEKGEFAEKRFTIIKQLVVHM